MAEAENLQLVQQVYGAIATGNIPALLSLVADDVEIVVQKPDDVPWGGTWRGKQAVQQWFGVLWQNFDYRTFEPREFIAQGDAVVALVHTEAVMRKTGKAFVNPLAHVFTFGRGELTRLRVYEDTAALVAAYS